MPKNFSANFCQENKERLKKGLHGSEHYKNLSEDQIQKLVDYWKKYYGIRKNPILQLL